MSPKKAPTYDEVVKEFKNNPPQWVKNMELRAQGIDVQPTYTPKPKPKNGTRRFIPVDTRIKKPQGWVSHVLTRDTQGRWLPVEHTEEPCSKPPSA